MSWSLLVIACAAGPLQTRELEPRTCRVPEPLRTGLYRFDDPRYDQLSSRLATWLAEGGHSVTVRRRLSLREAAAREDRVDLGVELVDLFSHVESDASSRRWTNIYFTVTVFWIWILPILSASDLFESSAVIEGHFRIHDFRADELLFAGELESSVEEKPSGYFGEDDEDFSRRMVERATHNLAALLYDELCRRWPRP